MGGAASLVGLSALAGWALDVEPLKRLVPGAIAMNPMTAVAMLLSSFALWGYRRDGGAGAQGGPGRRAVFLCAGAVALIGLIRLVGYAGGWDVVLDRLLFASRLAEPDGAPNRIAPNTALNFLFVGSALLIGGGPAGTRFGWLVQCLLFFVIFTSFLAFLGYIYDSPELYTIFDFMGMAVNTAVCFMILGVGVLASRPSQGIMAVVASPCMGGIVARRLLQVAFFVPVAFGWVGLKGLKAGLYDAEFGQGLLVTACVVLLITVILRISDSLNRADRERRKAEEEILGMNEELERRVSERTEQLEAANKELESFSYSVSHDLRAPLRSIDGFSQVLLEDYSDRLDAEGKDSLRRVRAATQRMAQLIDDILGLSRTTRAEMRFETVDLSAIAEAVSAELRKSEPGRDVEFVIAPGLAAEGDPRLLAVMIENLLGNAWKFTSRHARARIEFGMLLRDGRPVYFVRDDGAGFDMGYAGKLFGVFQRLHGTAEFEGTGIGLATVQRIMHRHGGRVWAEGEVEKGATFYFTFRP